MEENPFLAGIEVPPMVDELELHPDTELYSFLEDLGTASWFDVKPEPQQYYAQAPKAYNKRSYSAASDATDATEYHFTPQLSTYDSSISEVSTCTNSPMPGRTFVQNGRLTAMEIFHEFTEYYKDESGNLYVDASGIISRECYERWLSSRKKTPSRPEETFRKSILCHCTSSDGGSAPFSPEVEAALLKILRQPGKVWPCFQGKLDKHGKPIRIGLKGLRATGYHEKKQEKEQSQAKKRRVA
jgi:hypothetical protein